MVCRVSINDVFGERKKVVPIMLRRKDTEGAVLTRSHSQSGYCVGIRVEGSKVKSAYIEVDWRAEGRHVRSRKSRELR